MRRRKFIGGATVVSSIAVHAQQPEQMRRVGVLIGFPEDDPETKARVTAFRQELDRLGWSVGRNVRFDYCYSPGDSFERGACTCERADCFATRCRTERNNPPNERRGIQVFGSSTRARIHRAEHRTGFAPKSLR
jgi:hypothetical protein